MQPTIFGLIVLAAGVLLWRKGIAALFAITAVSTAFGGSAALLLPALGGTSVAPAHFSLVLPLLWVVLQRDRRAIGPALTQNLFLLVFVGYAVVAAFLLPRLFAGDMYVAPMRPVLLNGQTVLQPLGPSTQNITQSVYLVGTLATSLLATYVASTARDASVLVKALIVMTGVTVLLGLIDMVTWQVGLRGALDFLRNGSYAQLDQAVGNFRRISGQFPETSSYSAYGFALAALNCELWIRGIWARVTGPMAAIMMFALLPTTSSTSYLCLGLYGLLLAVRLTVLMYGPLKSTRLLWLSVTALVGVGFVMLLALAAPGFAESVTQILLDMTVNKTSSSSGQERLAWATQGLKAFVVSHGLGVGPGSFRSSSMLTAIIGAVGVVGVIAFLAHLSRILAPWSRRSYSLEADLGEATASAALFCIFGALMSGATADPGIMFGMLGGLALGYRLRRRTPIEAQELEDAPEPLLSPLERRRRRQAYLDARRT